MAKQGTKTKTVKPVDEVVEVNEFVQEEQTTIAEAPKEVASKKDDEGKVWVKDHTELVEVEGVNQTQKGKEYYGIKRKS